MLSHDPFCRVAEGRARVKTEVIISFEQLGKGLSKPLTLLEQHDSGESTFLQVPQID
jgi:hypothetical protein